MSTIAKYLPAALIVTCLALFLWAIVAICTAAQHVN